MILSKLRITSEPLYTHLFDNKKKQRTKERKTPLILIAFTFYNYILLYCSLVIYLNGKAHTIANIFMFCTCSGIIKINFLLCVHTHEYIRFDPHIFHFIFKLNDILHQFLFLVVSFVFLSQIHHNDFIPGINIILYRVQV